MGRARNSQRAGRFVFQRLDRTDGRRPQQSSALRFQRRKAELSNQIARREPARPPLHCDSGQAVLPAAQGEEADAQ